MKIKNRERLASAGDTASRKVVLEIIESSLQDLDSYRVIVNLLHLDGDSLRIGKRHWDLGRKRHLFVVGAGKACNNMARAVEEVLGDRIYKGLVIVKQLETEDRKKRIEIVRGGHPLPNEEGLLATRRILQMVEEASPEDLFISVISGGSSALMSCPVSGITLEDEIRVTEELLKCGARILEINAIRRHISATNGGRLAQRIENQGAEMINLIISDSVGSRPTTDPTQPAFFRGTPVAPDDTTLDDAWNVVKKYDLFSRIPPHILEFLQNAGPAQETPKFFTDRINHFVLQRPADACEAAKRAADGLGLKAMVLTTLLEGESREAGSFLASVAKEIAMNHRPLSPPCILIAGGETTTQIERISGAGGPSQELALGFSMEIPHQTGFGIIAIDTDGTDGPTEIAGGIADGTTVERAQQKGLDIHERLRAHDSSTILRALGDEIITGNTGTNVCDLNVIYISGSSQDQ
jgi:glycerate 2-kinase